MNQQFFEKIFPTQGYVCIAGIDAQGAIIPRFATSVDEALSLAQKFIDRKINVYFTPGTYEGQRRKQESCTFVKSFFLDLDVMHGKSKYDSKEQALEDVKRFCAEINWPEPTLLDSGGGIHAYWILEEELTATEWTEYAKKFKQLCLDHKMIIDENVPADSARLMRIPGTFNYRYDPPTPSVMLTDVYVYPFDRLVSALGNVPEQFDLRKVEKGLDEDTKAIYEARRGNFEYDFATIAVRSLEGTGCGQIKKLLTEDGCEEPLWYAGISVAARCRDADTAIHDMSEHDKRYSWQDTEDKRAQSLNEAAWSHGCEAFEKANREGCVGCPYRGKISGPIKLGEVLRVATESTINESIGDERDEPVEAAQADTVREKPNTQKVFPDFLDPFFRGVNGGVYWTPAPRSTKKGMVQDPPELILPFTTYPIQRLHSPHDGECLVVLIELPHDGTKQFLLPLKFVAAPERLKEVLTFNSVTFEPAHVPKLQSYFMKWSTFLTTTKRADIMRIQQGWTEDQESFVIGTTEYMANGEERYCPPSPLSKNVVRNLHTEGSYDEWKKCAQMFNDPGYEWHAFALLAGFASPLMELTNVNGVTLSLYSSGPGTGKTGAMYAASSVWGNPKALAVFEATPNALTQRMITLKNIVFTLDEQSNNDGKVISNLMHNVSSGTPKIRMKASTNEEREASFSTSQICITTTNKPLKDMMSEYKANHSAENVRVLEPEILMPSVPGYELDSARGKAMIDPLKSNFGFAGPDFIKQLYKIGIDEVRRRSDIEYLRVADKYTSNSEYRFIANIYAVTHLAGQIVNEHGILNFDLDRIFGVVGNGFLDIIAGKQHEDADTRADVVGDFINKNIQNCLVIRNDKVVTEPRNALYVRAEVDEGLIWVSSSAMKEYLRLIKLGTREFEDRLTKAGVLVGKGRKQMAAGWKDAFGSTNVQAYELKLDMSHLFNDEEAVSA